MRESSGMNIRFIIIVSLFLLTGVYIHTHKDKIIPTNLSLSSFPLQVASWRMTGETFMSDKVLDVLRPTDYISRVYTNGNGDKVSLYIGYHGGGEDAGEIHSPKHCLPGSGWYEIKIKKYKLSVGDDKLTLVRSIYQKGQQKEVFYYWFQVKGKTLDNEYALKVAEIINSMLYKRRDASFIRVSVAIDYDENKAIQSGESFIRDMYPVIIKHLPS